MSRFAPPVADSSPYITADGMTALQQEQRDIWKKRRTVTLALAAAAAEGDRSENAEYIYRKKELREIDRRIRYLQKRLPALRVVTQVGDTSRVFFGAWVTVQKEDGFEAEYRIVGGDEIHSDSSRGLISADSPLAKLMLKKQVGDSVVLVGGSGRQVFHIKGIRYA